MATLKEAAADAGKKTNGGVPGGAPQGLDAAARAAALKGSAGSDWRETGTRYLYKPEHFVVGKENGISRCYTKNVDGSESPTAPEICGVPYGTREGDGEFGPYTQILIQLTKPTFVKVGRSGAEVEQVVNVGETVMVTNTAGLERVASIAENLEYSVEVAIRPRQKEPVKGEGKDMWKWSIKESPNKIVRVQGSAPAQMGE